MLAPQIAEKVEVDMAEKDEELKKAAHEFEAERKRAAGEDQELPKEPDITHNRALNHRKRDQLTAGAKDPCITHKRALYHRKRDLLTRGAWPHSQPCVSPELSGVSMRYLGGWLATGAHPPRFGTCRVWVYSDNIFAFFFAGCRCRRLVSGVETN